MKVTLYHASCNLYIVYLPHIYFHISNTILQMIKQTEQIQSHRIRELDLVACDLNVK